MAKASNSLFGAAGNDRLEATAAATRSAGSINRLDGGVGDDILIGRIVTEVFPGSRSHSELFGGADADTLSVVGGKGNILDGGAGSDTLNCGDGADVCLFRRSYGDDSIGGLDEGADKIRLLDFGIDSFADLTLLAQGANTVIDLPTDTSVTVLDLAPDQLSAGDLLFA
jgi:serralysin